MARYVATVFLWPSRHRDRVEDLALQRRLRAFWWPLTRHRREFEFYPRAVHWCKLCVARKKRATEWWLIHECRAGDVFELDNHVRCPMRWTDRELRKIEEEHQRVRPIRRELDIPRALFDHLNLVARTHALTVEEFVLRAAADAAKREIERTLQ